MNRYLVPGWLPGRHAQTIWPILRKPPLPSYQRVRWETPDGDFIDVDRLPERHAAPLVVLFHGLEGSSRSHYARSLMNAVEACGWNGVVPHFRGCSGEPNRLARAYHSGDSAEIDWIVRRLAAERPAREIFVAGVSLGGNALLKWLGEQGRDAPPAVAASAAICPPLDLAISGHALARGFNQVYSRHFLRTLKRKALAKIAAGRADFDAAAIRAACTLHAFDDAYTAPAHGFDGADDYWKRASARPWMASIARPALLLCTDNDPFVPRTAWPLPQQISAAVHFERTRGGGHAGFVSGALPGHLNWLAQRVLEYFRHCGVATSRDNSPLTIAPALG